MENPRCETNPDDNSKVISTMSGNKTKVKKVTCMLLMQKLPIKLMQ
jgi:hypothetical protein